MAHYALIASFFGGLQLASPFLLEIKEKWFQPEKEKVEENVKPGPKPKANKDQKSMVSNSRPFIPNIFFFVNFVLWATYGAHKQNFLLQFGGIAGAVASGLYLYLFSRGHSTKRKQSVIAVCWVFLVIFSVELLDQSTELLGMLCCLSYICTHLSPLLRLRRVIRTRNLKLLPTLQFISFGTISSFSWIVYSLHVQDLNLMIPNLIGTATGLFQLFLIHSFSLEEQSEAFVV